MFYLHYNTILSGQQAATTETRYNAPTPIGDCNEQIAA